MANTLPILALTLALAACGNPPTRAQPQGQLARDAMDKAAAAYNDCVVRAADVIDIAQMQSGDLQAGTAADTIIKGCVAERKALIAKVYDVRRIGHPSDLPAVSQSVAEQSVDAIEGELRERAVTTIVSRQVGTTPPAALEVK